jgi:hypothetical protein
MKPRITPDVLRGILIAYAGRQCYMFARTLPVFVSTHGGTVVGRIISVFAASVPIIAYCIVLVALLARRAPNITFVLIFMLAAIEFFATLPALEYQWAVVQCLVLVGAVVLAYLYRFRVCTPERPNQAMQPTASPRTVPLSDD